MALALNDLGSSPQQPITYNDLGVIPQPILGPQQPTTTGPVQAPQFQPGPSLPHIPGATLTVTGPTRTPLFSPPPPASPTQAPTQTPPPPQNLNNLIDSFPGVSNALGLEQMALGQLDANLNAARQRAIIQFGDPALAQMAGFGLDPQAGAFAQQNYLSGNATLARLDKQHQQAAQSVINALASHGLLNSGDLGYREGQENQAYGNNVYDAQQSVLSQLADLYNSYLSQRYGLEQNANSAQLAALQAFLSNPDAYSMLGGTSQAPAATTTKTQKTTPTSKTKAAPADALARYLKNNG